MSNTNPSMDDDPGYLREQLSAFEHKLSELIDMADRLKVENESLRAQQINLVEERSRLIEKNELARVRVEAIVTRLKSLETA